MLEIVLSLQNEKDSTLRLRRGVLTVSHIAPVFAPTQLSLPETREGVGAFLCSLPPYALQDSFQPVPNPASSLPKPRGDRRKSIIQRTQSCTDTRTQYERLHNPSEQRACQTFPNRSHYAVLMLGIGKQSKNDTRIEGLRYDHVSISPPIFFSFLTILRKYFSVFPRLKEEPGVSLVLSFCVHFYPDCSDVHTLGHQ